MSAQPSQHISTRLLIAEKSENAAHALDSTLRDAGIATKLMMSDDLAHIAQLIADDATDIVLLTDKLDGLEKFLPRIHANAPHVPLVMLLSEQAAGDCQWSHAKALGLGATDIVQQNDAEHLSLVVHRELAHVFQREHTAQLRRALKEAEQRCQLLLQGSKAAIAYVHEGMHIYANDGYLSMFGYANLEDLGGVSLVDLLSPECAAELKQHLKALRNGRQESVMDFTANGPSGGFSGSMTLTDSQYEGESCLQVTIRQNPAENQSDTAQNNVLNLPVQGEAEAAPQELGLSGFSRAAETLFNSDNDECYLLIAGIDDFEKVREDYGLLGAESMSRQIWTKLNEHASDYPLSKINSHQFVVAVTAKSREAVREIAEQLRSNTADSIMEVQGKTVRPTVSIAGAQRVEDESVSSVLDEAFALLTQAAADGQSNCVNLPCLNEDGELENDGGSQVREILKQITHAIDNKSFVLLFQPIISLRGDSDEHYEVFLRMIDANGDQVVPSDFLQTAIDNNVAGKIDRWVILQSIKTLSVHRAKGNTTRLTINLTANSVIDKEFPQWLGVAMKAARLPSDAVIFQITERDATTYLRQSREFVSRLRQMHCRASLSRFGLVEDPFETLRHVPVDMVKVDGSYIQALDTNGDSREQIMDTIHKLQAQGKLTVVPMVENANVLSTLWQAGANYIQGHYLQEPSSEMDYDFSTDE
ncbi:MAG: EAL domain-containing protein [Pseudomonadota bacterium]